MWSWRWRGCKESRLVGAPGEVPGRAGRRDREGTYEVAGRGVVADRSPGSRAPGGLGRGEGIDAGKITIRHLLQHTSGLPNYTEYLGLEDFEKVQHRYVPNHELLAAALSHPAKFAPGAKWECSIMIEKVTGRPLHEQITESVIKNAGQLISTPSCLGRFFRVLLEGKLLPAAQLAEMRKTVDAPLYPGEEVRLGPDEHPAQLRRGVLGSWRGHPRVRNSR
ncbi:serine hydrolase [Amycolatopsis azurea]|uniref:serine hydrolase n=1 Tax=Amycolatopsis azurea TaxID=36819 RepID=UPI0037F18925